jgi:hypothetical protein
MGEPGHKPASIFLRAQIEQTSVQFFWVKISVCSYNRGRLRSQVGGGKREKVYSWITFKKKKKKCNSELRLDWDLMLCDNWMCSSGVHRNLRQELRTLGGTLWLHMHCIHGSHSKKKKKMCTSELRLDWDLMLCDNWMCSSGVHRNLRQEHWTLGGTLWLHM